MKLRSYRPKMWVMMALTSTFVVSLIIGGIVLAYRVVIKREYLNGLSAQLAEALQRLETDDFSMESADEVRADGIRLLILRETDGEILWAGEGREPFFGESLELPTEGQEGDDLNRTEAVYLLNLVQTYLGRLEGSRYFADRNNSDGSSLENKELYLVGRSGVYVFGLSLPVESTNAAMNMALRYGTSVAALSWIISIFLIYLLSRRLTKPHKSIVQVASRISNLDFSRRCPPAGTRELNDLSCSINGMSDRLQTAVTDLRQTNDRLQVELEKRIRQQRLTTELLANLSHDLKTPIAIISGYAEGLQEGVARTEDQRERYYNTILKESEHMQGIVHRMLALTRLESGEVPLVMEDFDLAALTDDVIELFRREIQRQSLVLDIDYAHPLMARTDYESIRQCIINYIQNAVYHINGGNQIRVRIRREAGQLRLSAANSSAPIREEELPRLWDKLYRGDHSRQRSHGEAGLGLAIVRGNLERLGLPYGVRNLAEGMVEFWLCVPAAEEASAALPAAGDPTALKPTEEEQ